MFQLDGAAERADGAISAVTNIPTRSVADPNPTRRRRSRPVLRISVHRLPSLVT